MFMVDYSYERMLHNQLHTAQLQKYLIIAIVSFYSLSDLTGISTLTKASLTSRACSTLRGVATLSPRVIRVRVVKQTITSLGSTYRTQKDTGIAVMDKHFTNMHQYAGIQY